MKKIPHPEFEQTLLELMDIPQLKAMQQFPQHNNSNTYAHCVQVARSAMRICSALHLQVDEASLARGAMLHDYYGYCFHQTDISAWKHSTSHAQTALTNAEALFELNDIERNIIYSHMWPLNITHIPRYRESFAVTLADKYVATREFLRH